MGWRFIEQPDGKLARFSEIVDSFTHWGMTDQEAIVVAISECNCGLETARKKVLNARVETPERWTEALRIIRDVHGQRELDSTLTQMGFSTPPAQEADDANE